MQPIDPTLITAQIESLIEETRSMKDLQGKPLTEEALSDLSDKIVALVKSVLQEPSLSEDVSIQRSLQTLETTYKDINKDKLSSEVEEKVLTVTENIKAIVQHHFPSPVRDVDLPDPITETAPNPATAHPPRAATPQPVVAAPVLSPEELLGKINEGTPILGLVTTETLNSLLKSSGGSIINLNLSGIRITSENLEILLTRCPNIKLLILHNCSITDEIVGTLAKHPTTKQILGLDLSNNQIAMRGARELTKALNKTRPEALLKFLDLSNNPIPPETQKTIYDSLKKNSPDLTLLTDLYGEEIATESPETALKAASTSSVLSHEEDLVRKINRNFPIKGLGFDTEGSLIDLLKSQGKQITSLDLSGIPLSSEGLQSILTLCPNLKHLIARNCSITDALAITLAEHPNTKKIYTLDVTNNEITDAGAEALIAIIEESQLMEMRFSNNKISRRMTPEEVGLFKSLNTKTPAKDLGLTEKSLITLLKAYSNQFFHLTAGFLLARLNLSDMPLSEEGLQSILTLCPNLEYLKAQNCRITDRGAAAIAKALENNYLEEIDLCGNDITDKGAAAISRKIDESDDLRKVRLDSTRISKDMMDFMINKHKKIEFSTPTSEADKLSQLTLGVPVRELGLTEASLIALLKTSGGKIQTLDLSDMELSARGMQRILMLCPDIKKLTAGNCRIDDDLAALIATHPNAKNISLLDLTGNKITDRGTTAIALHMPKVEVLLLGNNQISNAGAEEIALGMPEVKFLDLSRNRISSVGATHIAGVLERFTKLNLSYNEIDDVGAKALRNKLFTMSAPISINFLDLSENTQISDQMMASIRHIADLKKIEFLM